MRMKDQSFSYNKNEIDSTNLRLDRNFINDKFWVLIPFQLVWDSDASISEVKKAKAPVSQKEMDMITILYPEKGGYTPGDAYDIYFDKG